MCLGIVFFMFLDFAVELHRKGSMSPKKKGNLKKFENSENTVYENLWVTAKVLFREKTIIVICLNFKRKFKINHLNFHFKKKTVNLN